MPAGRRPKVLVVVFDALRRDLLTPEIAPNLCRLMAEGADCPVSRTVFPSETRVATPSFSTGAPPEAHGIVANTFFDPTLGDPRPFNTGTAEMLAIGTRAYGGRLVTAPTLGETLKAAGLRYVAVSTGTAGNARFLNPTARSLGQPTFSVQGPGDSTPAADHAAVVERFGPVPEASIPNLARCRYGTDVLLEHMIPRFDPDVAVIWYSEPDIAYHYRGIGSPESVEATRFVDAELGRILDWRAQSPEAERIQLLLMSDHGQITTRESIDVVGAMRAAGFRAGERLEPDVDYVCLASNSGNVWVRDGDAGRIERLVAWLREQPWTGTLFTAGANAVEGSVKGTLAHSLVMTAHPRTPHVVYTLATDDEPNAHGAPGRGYFGADPVPAGYGGVHGGLHPMELTNLTCWHGSLFRERARLASPCGIVDATPTILHALGIARPPAMRGRPALAAFAAGEVEDRPGIERVFEAEAAGYRQRLAVLEQDGCRWLDGGGRA